MPLFEKKEYVDVEVACPNIDGENEAHTFVVQGEEATPRKPSQLTFRETLVCPVCKRTDGFTVRRI
jgi:hypothetical protein